MLHELCGAPMVLWPVRAALDAGAGRVVVVDSPQRALEGVLPAGVELVVQERPNGTGGAVLAAVSEMQPDPAATVVVLSGDVPLVSSEAIEGLIKAHRDNGAAATMVTTMLEDPSGYGRVLRDSSGALERVVETKQSGDSTPEERAIREVNTGIYAFDAKALERDPAEARPPTMRRASSTCLRCFDEASSRRRRPRRLSRR